MPPNSELGLKKMLELLPKNSVILDVGSGINDPAKKFFEPHGHKVETCDLLDCADYVGDYMKLDIPKVYDAVWVAHTLEHQLNVNNFLLKVKSNLKDNGLLCITVPPQKFYIVSGHYTWWSAGLLLYNLVMAGFDCSEAICRTYGYNISVIVRKKSFDLPSDLTYHGGDMKRLKDRFPSGPNLIKNCNSNFDGRIENLNWD